jgi:hypothetical protein
MPHGDIERLKISGYMVRYGIMDDDTFVLLAEEEDHSEKMLEGVKNQTTHLFSGTVRMRHYYMYDDSNDGVTESIPANVKKVK